MLGEPMTVKSDTACIVLFSTENYLKNFVKIISKCGIQINLMICLNTAFFSSHINILS